MANAKGDRDLLVRGIRQHGTVETDQYRERPVGPLHPTQQRASLVGIQGMKEERQPASLQEIAELVGTRGPALAHHAHHRRPPVLPLLPVAQHLRHGVVEVLIGNPTGQSGVAVDPAQ